MLGLLSPQVLGIAAIVAVAGGFFGGWKVRDAFCDAAAANREIQIARDIAAALQQQINAAHQADIALKDRTAQDREALEQIKGQLDGITQKISTSDCFTATDVDKLRELWGQPTGPTKPPAVPDQRQ